MYSSKGFMVELGEKFLDNSNVIYQLSKYYSDKINYYISKNLYFNKTNSHKNLSLVIYSSERTLKLLDTA